MNPTTAPSKPRPVTLRRTRDGRLPAYTALSGRFTVTRNPAEPGVPFCDSGFDVVDTRGANILGHAHTNRTRVYDLDDARGVIEVVLRREYLYNLQRFIDAERERMGLPTIAEDAAARSRRQRTGASS